MPTGTIRPPPSAAPTYNLNAGKLIVTSIGQGPGAAAFNFNGGTLQAGAAFSTTLPIGLNTSGGNAAIDSGGYAVTLSGTLSGPGNLIKVDSGTLALTAANTYAGGTSLSGGTLQLGSAGALGTGGLAISAGLFDLNTWSIAILSLAGTAGTISDLSTTGSGTTTLSVTQSANTTFAGTIQDGPKKLLALSKSGSGPAYASGTNTYTGPTTISQGKLVVDGSLTNSAVSVNGGTLGGTGYLNSVTVYAGGNLAPGDSLGACT